MRKNPWQSVRDFYHNKAKSGEGSNLESRKQQKTERKEKLDPVTVKESGQASL